MLPEACSLIGKQPALALLHDLSCPASPIGAIDPIGAFRSLYLSITDRNCNGVM